MDGDGIEGGIRNEMGINWNRNCKFAVEDELACALRIAADIRYHESRYETHFVNFWEIICQKVL